MCALRGQFRLRRLRFVRAIIRFLPIDGLHDLRARNFARKRRLDQCRHCWNATAGPLLEVDPRLGSFGAPPRGRPAPSLAVPSPFPHRVRQTPQRHPTPPRGARFAMMTRKDMDARSLRRRSVTDVTGEPGKGTGGSKDSGVSGWGTRAADGTGGRRSAESGPRRPVGAPVGVVAGQRTPPRAVWRVCSRFTLTARTHEGPLGFDLPQAPEAESSKSHHLLDPPNGRLRHPFAACVTVFGPRRLPASQACGPWRDTPSDRGPRLSCLHGPAVHSRRCPRSFLQRLRVRFAAIARVRQDLLRRLATCLRHRVDHRDQLALVARVVRHRFVASFRDEKVPVAYP